MMIAPLLVRLPSIALGAMLAGVFAWCIEGWQLFLLLRPQILLFFLVGVLACRFSLNTFVERLPMLPVTAAFAVVGAGQCRSEERRVGTECVSTCSSRWSPYHVKTKQVIHKIQS